MTATEGMASSRVVSFTAAAVWMRALMPKKTTPATTTTKSSRRRTTRNARGREGGRAGGRITIGSLSIIESLLSIGCHSLPVQHAEHCRYKEQGGDGGENQPTD